MPRESSIESATRFDDRAADYVRYRPTYPAEAIDAILDGLGASSSLLAADLGAGTGISARLLGDRGVRVVAIEPSSGMRGAAGSHSHVRFISARAEATALRSGCLDVVLSAQSFHWFHPANTLAECARILKPEGRLAIMWNRRSTIDPFTDGYRRAIIEVGGDSGVDRMAFDPAVIVESGRFSRPERLVFPNQQRLDLAGLIGRAHSASYCPKEGPAADRLTELLEALWRKHADRDGLVTLVYETELYRTQRR